MNRQPKSQSMRFSLEASSPCMQPVKSKIFQCFFICLQK